ncbi:MAG TPA: hypothetical protein VF339_09160 [Gammaproteobacteria bacterium]
MRARTEDLLTLRDGGPIDAALRARLAADPDAAREIERLTRVAEDLRRLPVLEPPPGIWERIAAETAARRQARIGLRSRAAAAAAAIAAVALLWLAAPWRAADRVETATAPADRVETAAAPSETRPARLPLERAAEPDSGADYAAPRVDYADRRLDSADRRLDSADPREDYARLVAESARLELMLSELDGSPRLMNAGTARTIADLEDYIGLVDEQLSYAEARGVDLRYREALWRERVDVMNALLYVRYAQAQRPTY